MLKTGSFLLCFYTGETSRLWWASVLLLSDPRQSGHTVRVPYQPSVFAPFCFKSAGLALSWASAVLLWFLALLYIFLIDLSIRRVHKEIDMFFVIPWKELLNWHKTEAGKIRPAHSPPFSVCRSENRVGLIALGYGTIINMYRTGWNNGRDTYTNFIYRAYKVCTTGHFWWEYFPECPEKVIKT